MATLISIIIILAAILLIVVVFIQNPKGGGLTNDFGTQQLGGVQRANDFVEKATWGLSAAIVILSIALSSMIQPVVVNTQPDPNAKGTDGKNAPANNDGKTGNSTKLPASK